MVALFKIWGIYALFVLPIIVLWMWTRFGDWYKYDVGWMMMSLDIALWLLDFPAVLHLVFHVDNTTQGFQIYTDFNIWLIVFTIAWRGWKVYKTLRTGRKLL